MEKIKEKLLETTNKFEEFIKSSSVNLFYKVSVITEVAKMTSIPHFNMMTADHLMQLLVSTNFEKTEKMDGANWSCGILNGKTYTKTKRGKPETNPEAHFKLKSLNWSIYDAFGRSINMLNKGNFPKFYKQIEQEYKDRIINQFKPKRFNGIAIFGEIFGNNQSNALAYDPAAVGTGALIIFGVKVDDGTPRGIELSTDKIGYEIMNKFIRSFNGIDGWKLYNKRPVGLNVNKTYIKAIKNFLAKHLDEIKSRKRDSESLLKKTKAKAELERIVTNFKKHMLKQIGPAKSFLGDTEIEGVIIRNKDNGAIAKIVDIDRFTALNIKNWVGRKEVVDEKKKLYKDIIEKVVNSADIFIIQSKIQQKLTDYLEYKGKNKFDSLDELLFVIYEDAAEEVQLKSAKQMVNDITKLLNNYIKEIKLIEKRTKDKQKDPKTKIDDFNFDQTMNNLEQEYKDTKEFVNSLQSALRQKRAWTEVIRYLLGNKTIEDLVKNYVK